MTLPDIVVQLCAQGESCTGFLIDDRTIVTAAHFLRGKTGALAIRVHGSTKFSKVYAKIPSTDVAVVILPTAVSCESYYPLASTPPMIGSRVYTIGYGGKKVARTLRGRYLAPLFMSTNSTFETWIRRAGLVLSWPKAIPGDSGGPVFCDGKIVGLQSLVYNPKWTRIGVATISLLPAYRHSMRRTVAALKGVPQA